MNKIEISTQNAIDWKKETGIEIVYDVMSRNELEQLWSNWQKMPYNLKKESDKKSIELFGVNNKTHFYKLQNLTKYDGFPFVLHLHNPRNGSEHYDLRFLDLKNHKLLHSFALPDNWRENPKKTVLFKTRDHDPRWLDLKSYRLQDIDKGTINYKIYKPYGYFLLEFNGNVINGLYQIFKLRDKLRKDIWMMVKK